MIINFLASEKTLPFFSIVFSRRNNSLDETNFYDLPHFRTIVGEKHVPLQREVKEVMK